MAVPEWLAAVTIGPDPIVQGTLIGRARSAPPAPSTWVTDLVDPRPAYWKRVRPVAPSPERVTRMESGRRLHESIGRVLARPEHREVRLRYGGIVGQVDLFGDVPTEVKTTGRELSGDGTLTPWPEHLDQLGMYCALADRTLGRLYLVRAEPDSVAANAWDVVFSDLGGLRNWMVARATKLQAALASNDPSPLPRCGWFGRGCEFQAAGACDCSGAEPTEPSGVRARAGPTRENPVETERLKAAAREAATTSRPVVHSVRDLLYPRRAYFDRRGATAAPPPGPASPRPRSDLWAVARDLLEDSGIGEVSRRFPPHGALNEPIQCLDDDPVLIKTNRTWPPPTGGELARRQPQYFLDLALRARLLGSRHARLILALERAESWEDRLRVFDVEISRPEVVDALLDDRRRSLEDAVRTGDPTGLVRCPGWMFSECPYRAECGCGVAEPPPRDQR